MDLISKLALGIEKKDRNMSDMFTVINSLFFAAEKHKKTKRKGGDTPYINHPIHVAYLLTRYANVTDPITIGAALNHDVIEDENVTDDELTARTNQKIALVVAEVSDNPNISKSEQIKELVKKAPGLSSRAAVLKLADKTSNMISILETPPDWPRSTKLKYFKQAKEVVENLPFLSSESDPLKYLFYSIYDKGMIEFKK